jgi:hypothetical protein
MTSEDPLVERKMTRHMEVGHGGGTTLERGHNNKGRGAGSAQWMQGPTVRMQMHPCIARYARFKGIVRCVSNHTRLFTDNLIQERIGVHNLREGRLEISRAI